MEFLIVGLTLGIAYGLIYRLSRNFITRIGKESIKVNEWRFAALSEAFGAAKEVKVAGGEVPESVTIVENGALFEAPLLTGQKTGWFYDQRDNRARLQRYVKDKTVLDVCSYVGGWSITSLMMGAKSATAVDQSEHALKFAMQSAEKNGVEDRLSTIQDDCFAALKALKRKGRKFEVIVVDPPAFIKRRKDIKEGMLAYQRLNALAMELLVEGGILISCSCPKIACSKSIVRS